MIFVPGFVQPQEPASGFEAPSLSASSTYVPPTTRSYPGGFIPYHPSSSAAVTPNDDTNSPPNFENYNPTSGGNGGSSSEGTI